ncbi:hypothetical protein GQ568_03360 [Patescibacteria group bacterium]|nr:hypothetical protein [Patescibacteria group bacterium]
MDEYNLLAYRGDITSFVNITFRGGAKTARTKLFIAFCISNDEDHYRKYIKVLSADVDNCTQITTDIYNMLVNTRGFYNLFQKSSKKREERMSSFTTSTGIKVKADTVGTDQRGSIQEEARPDLIWNEDIESRTTLRSAIKTKMIADNLEEARTGLAIGGSSIYTANYISEAGNVHQLIHKKGSNKKVLIIPIIKDGASQWDRYSLQDIENMRKDDEDFEGERLCRPDAGKDIYFNRDMLDKQVAIQPIKNIAGFKIYKEYNPSHRIAGGHDVAGGVQLDSSTSVFIDFDTVPAQVIGVFASNTIAPEAFGDEIYSQGNHFGGCLLGIENNKFDQTILKAKILGAKLYMTQPKAIKSSFNMSMTYGWNTNTLTKSQMMSSLREAIESGLINLNDEDLIQECKGYTRNDIIDKDPDIRLTTRHFDLLIALAIAWQMREHARVKKVKQYYDEKEDEGINEAR